MPAGRYYEYENASNTAENSSSRQGWAMRGGFVGSLDDIRVYNRILSESEVKDLYMEGTFSYTINSLTLKDGAGAVLDEIPDEGFFLRVEVKKHELADDAIVMVTSYTDTGRMLNCTYLEADGPGGTTYALGTWMDHTKGRIGHIKAMVLSSLAMPTPMAESMELSK